MQCKQVWRTSGINIFLCRSLCITYVANYNWNKHINEEKTKTFFEKYFEVKATGKPMGVWKFAKEVGISGVTVNRMSDKVGLPTMGFRRYAKGTRSETNNRDKRIIYAFKNTRLSALSIAKFENMTVCNVQRIIEEKLTGEMVFTKKRRSVTHYQASQVYEAIDAGFEHRDLEELLELKTHQIDHAITHRNNLEPEIIEGLRVLKQDPSTSKPYL